MSHPFQTARDVRESAPSNRTHDLKAWPHFFEAMADRSKSFEIRRNDRNYRVGDTLRIRKYDPSFGFYGDEPLLFEVTYAMFDEDFPAIMPGFVVLGIKPA